MFTHGNPVDFTTGSPNKSKGELLAGEDLFVCVLYRRVDGGDVISLVCVCTVQTGRSALHLACFHGYVDIVGMLIGRGADIDAMDTSHHFTPLYMAAQNGHKSIVGVLLQNRANKVLATKVGVEIIHNDRIPIISS
jgi:hypothetical protein